MNERIKLLFEQAHIQPPATVSGQFAFTPPKTFSPEKFAELIVLECAGRVDHILRERQAGGGTMGDDIREHFGVEE